MLTNTIHFNSLLCQVLIQGNLQTEQPIFYSRLHAPLIFSYNPRYRQQANPMILSRLAANALPAFSRISTVILEANLQHPLAIADAANGIHPAHPNALSLGSRKIPIYFFTNTTLYTARNTPKTILPPSSRSPKFIRYIIPPFTAHWQALPGIQFHPVMSKTAYEVVIHDIRLMNP